MAQHGEFERLTALLNDLYLCTGVKFALIDENAREVYTSSYQAPFCREIMRMPGGRERCQACDRNALERVRQTGTWYKYICHAGLYETAVPVPASNPAATILFGQMLDDAPREEQWARIARCCAWHGDQDTLRQAFEGLRPFSVQQMAACADILEVCIRQANFPETRYHDPAFALRNYIDLHFSQHIGIPDICLALHVSKTQLYALCRSHFGKTPLDLVNSRRIEEAKVLLTGTDAAIADIARRVGIPDANYFTKFFLQKTGMLPSVFRRTSSSG